MQLCPQLINLPFTAPEAAFSISASSQTMNGSLPPNSRTVFFSCHVALCATLAPTGTLPVKVTASISSESMRYSASLDDAIMFEILHLVSLPFQIFFPFGYRIAS